MSQIALLQLTCHKNKAIPLGFWKSILQMRLLSAILSSVNDNIATNSGSPLLILEMWKFLLPATSDKYR